VGSGDGGCSPVTDVAESEADDTVHLDQAPDDSSTIRRVAWFVGLMVVLLLVRGFVVEPVRVGGDSMEPNLNAGALLLIDKVSLHARDPHRGEVIVTHDPRSGRLIVKRVVAIAGDSVGIDDGRLMLNGKAVVENYVDNKEMEGFYFGPDVVPTGQVFVLGDNRADSIDSRTFGPVPIDSIDGRVLTTIWPLG